MNNKHINASAELYIGLMSGTSADGIDLALVDMAQGQINFVTSDFTPYDANTRKKITSLYTPENNEIDQAMTLSIELANLFATAINSFIEKLGLTNDKIIAIGNHGQTIRHRPEFEHAFTLQIACHQTLAALTKIRVIGDFRTKDMVYGGQGAPLVPAFHRELFGQLSHQNSNISNTDNILINIGGIANLTYLPADKNKQVIGYDTGPGNCLLDSWFQQYNDGSFDRNGDWAKTGKTQQGLLSTLLSDNYFAAAFPKSTGREYFTPDWLSAQLSANNVNDEPAENIQATLLQLTATSIANDILKLSDKANIYLCGGGSLNQALVSAIKSKLPQSEVTTIASLNIENDAFEAMAFAWLAYAFDQKLCGNIPSVTGASKAVILGVEYSY